MKATINIRKKINKIALFKYNYLFLNKIFKKFTEKGKKNKVYFMFFHWVQILSLKKIKLNIILIQIVRRLCPILFYRHKQVKGKTIIIPFVKNTKLKNINSIYSLSASWLKKSVKTRKEKTLILRLYSELKDIRKNKGSSVRLRNNYHKDFILNKRYFKRRKKWL